MKNTRLLSFLFTALATGPAFAQVKVQEIVPTGTDLPYTFGRTLAVDENTAAVSGLVYGTSGTHYSVTIYERIDERWRRTQELSFGYPGGRAQLAIDGDTMFVGRVNIGQNRGRVHVFERSAGVWTQTQLLIPASSTPESHFGRRIDIDGDRAVISAPMDPAQTYRGGAVFVYEKVGGVWTEMARIEPTLACCRPFFGLSVALDGDVLVAGEPGYFGGGPGYAHVYRYDGSNWSLEERLQETYSSGFGYAVDIEDGRMAVGAYRERTQPGAVEGAVHLYRKLGGNWFRTQSLWPTDPRIDSGFGASLELNGPRLVVSSGASEISLGDSVQVFAFESGAFVLKNVVAGESGSEFGSAVAIGRGQVLIGVPDGSSTGSVSTYWLPLGQEVCVSSSNSTGSAAVLRGLGSSSPADDDLALRASPVPDTRGVFAMATSRTNVPFGDGVQCLANQRFILGVDQAEGGVLALDIDFSTSVGMLLTPGSHWNLQAYFRDPMAGGTGFNSSNSIFISFSQ